MRLALENEEVTCVASGKTLPEVQKNIKDAIALQIEGMLEDGVKIPAEFLGEREYEYHMNTRT